MSLEKKGPDNYKSFLNPELPIPLTVKIIVPLIAAFIGYFIWYSITQ